MSRSIPGSARTRAGKDMVRRKYKHASEATIRFIETRLAAWPDVSYAQIAGEAGVSRGTVKRIAGKNGKNTHRPKRQRKAERCPGCGGALKKKGIVCRACVALRLQSHKRLARAAARSTPRPTRSTP